MTVHKYQHPCNISPGTMATVIEVVRLLPDGFKHMDVLLHPANVHSEAVIHKALLLMFRAGQLTRLTKRFKTFRGEPIKYAHSATFPAKPPLCLPTPEKPATGQLEAKEPILSAREQAWREFRATISVEVEDHMRDWDREGELHSKAMGRTSGRGRGR